MSAPKSTEGRACVVATHDVLFAADATLRCDVCNEPIDDDDGCRIQGRGVYISTRGTEVRREEAPLCSRCACGIGAFCFARAEIEEEED